MCAESERNDPSWLIDTLVGLQTSAILQSSLAIRTTMYTSDPYITSSAIECRKNKHSTRDGDRLRTRHLQGVGWHEIDAVDRLFSLRILLLAVQPCMQRVSRHT